MLDAQECHNLLIYYYLLMKIQPSQFLSNNNNNNINNNNKGFSRATWGTSTVIYFHCCRVTA